MWNHLAATAASTDRTDRLASLSGTDARRPRNARSRHPGSPRARDRSCDPRSGAPRHRRPRSRVRRPRAAARSPKRSSVTPSCAGARRRLAASPEASPASPVLLYLTSAARRLGLLLIVVSFLVFACWRSVRAPWRRRFSGARPATPETVEAIRSEYHLDEPFLVQYWYWARDAAHLDLGRSITSGDTVTHLVQRAPSRVACSGRLHVAPRARRRRAARPSGGIRHGTRRRPSVTTLTVVGMSAPAFAVGLLLLYSSASSSAGSPSSAPAKASSIASTISRCPRSPSPSRSARWSCVRRVRRRSTS